MPTLNARITIWPNDESDVEEFEPGEVDYVSLVNEATYGIPPLLTKTKVDGIERPPVCGDGETVLYVNPENIMAMKVEKL